MNEEKLSEVVRGNARQHCKNYVTVWQGSEGSYRQVASKLKYREYYCSSATLSEAAWLIKRSV
jgi:hypothetical protein